jgi:hypothetical protein
MAGDTSYDRGLPVDEAVARDLTASEVARLDDPQAHRVERAVFIEGRVVLELRPVGLHVPDTVRITLSGCPRRSSRNSRRLHRSGERASRA